MNGSELWLIAGPNGVGKTTITTTDPIHSLIAGGYHANPDVRTLEILNEEGFGNYADAPAHVLRDANIQAANEVFAELQDCLKKDQRVVVETVLSSSKYQPVVESVLENGGSFMLIYVAKLSPDVSVARVQLRVQKGGHDVPEDKIRSRWHRSLKLLPWFARRADLGWVYDNTDDDPRNPPRLIATIHGGVATMNDRHFNPGLSQMLAPLEAT